MKTIMLKVFKVLVEAWTITHKKEQKGLKECNLKVQLLQSHLANHQRELLRRLSRHANLEGSRSKGDESSGRCVGDPLCKVEIYHPMILDINMMKANYKR